MFFSFIICAFSILIIIISKYIWDINIRKLTNLVSIINNGYLEFWNVRDMFEKFWNRVSLFILVVIVGVISYLSIIRLYREVYSVIVIFLTIILFIITMIIMYFIFGVFLLIASKFNEYINKIQNIKTSNKLTLSFMCIAIYSTFLIFLKDKLIIQSYYFIFCGLIINYSVNFDLLLNIIKNPQYLISTTKLRKTIKVNREILKSMWIGAMMLLLFIIMNLFLGVLAINNINNQAYTGSGLANQSRIFDLLYYTIITFTTIGYGDIVPNAPESKVMAIIISFTSVICLIIFISSMLSAGSNYIKNSKNYRV